MAGDDVREVHEGLGGGLGRGGLVAEALLCDEVEAPLDARQLALLIDAAGTLVDGVRLIVVTDLPFGFLTRKVI